MRVTMMRYISCMSVCVCLIDCLFVCVAVMMGSDMCRTYVDSVLGLLCMYACM
jgi:hypothetical protein